MDADMLRTILNNYGVTTITKFENYNDVSRKTLLCSDTVLNTLCTSLCNLLHYKVSKEAYQRYSVQLLIIDILQKWCRMISNFDHLQIFTSIENTLKFVGILLKKYLTDDILIECRSENALISLTIAVIHLSVENPSFMYHVDRLLIRLSQLETNNKIEELLHNALCSNLHLKLSTKEEIYASQKLRLVEEPLLNSFACMFPVLKKKDCVDSCNNQKTLNQLLEFSARSAYVFQLISYFLKELLVQLQYTSTVLNFINLILKQISICCKSQNRDILDLYPRKLHSCIILLKIKPEHHTVQTRKYTLQSMKQIFNENKNVLLILMSHFPEWLECFVSYVTNNMQH